MLRHSLLIEKRQAQAERNDPQQGQIRRRISPFEGKTMVKKPAYKRKQRAQRITQQDRNVSVDKPIVGCGGVVERKGDDDQHEGVEQQRESV